MNKINVTDARKDMSTFFDGVIHEKPIILKKRRYEAVLIEKSLLSVFLSNEMINVSTLESKEKTVVVAKDLNITGEGNTKFEAIENLCENLFAYANDVYTNFMFYYYGQNIREKLGYVFHILLCENNNQLKEIMSFATTKRSKKN